MIQVQAVKLNIGVTVTANLAIFLFLVQVKKPKVLRLENISSFRSALRSGFHNLRRVLTPSPWQRFPSKPKIDFKV